ncbi:hypothetical protein TYRP_003540 [Tyrophagus putrescentiae]|nr:hypothetical protein TYRP_003540 [Tyrophagus putrescentiae]
MPGTQVVTPEAETEVVNKEVVSRWSSVATVKEPNEESQDSQNGNSEKSFVTNGSAVEEEFKEVKKTKVESSKRKSITEEEPEVSPKKLKASLAELIDLSESDDDDDLMHFFTPPGKVSHLQAVHGQFGGRDGGRRTRRPFSGRIVEQHCRPVPFAERQRRVVPLDMFGWNREKGPDEV